MAPKWAGTVVMLIVAARYWNTGGWIALPIGFLWFFPNEYVVHRWLYHRVAVSKEVRGPARSHIMHHIDPTDLRTVFNPPPFSVGIGIVYLFLVWGITGNIGVAAAFSLGNFLALLYYEYTHFTAHRPGVTPWMPWNRFLKKMHLWHHYKNEHHWFGVTNKVFDKTFGSYRDPEGVDKSPTVRSLVPPDQLAAFIDDGASHS